MATKYKPSDVLTVEGISKSLNDWATELGCPPQSLIARLKRDWSEERTVKEPIDVAAGGQNRGKKVDADVLVGDEVDRLLRSGNKTATFIRDRALIALAYRAGLRCTEILSLFPKDIDLERGTITVHHGKGDQHGVVAMDAFGWAHVTEWLQLRSTWSIDDTAPLFCTQHGTRISDRQVRAMFQRRTKKAEIAKHVHPHGMRRTMASEMAAEGIPMIDISGAMRHKRTSTTDTYLKRVCPTSVLDAMKNRGRGGVMTPTTSRSRPVPPPDWLPRLQADIGDRLMMIHDGRQNEDEFKAVVLLF